MSTTFSGVPKTKYKIPAIIAAGNAIVKFIRNLSLISTPCVVVATIVVSEITDKLSPKNAPPNTAAKP